MKIRLLIISLFFFNISSLCYSQHKEKRIELQHLYLNTSELDSILSELIISEKKCDYYTCSLIFVLNIKRTESVGTLSMTIESIIDKNITLSLEPFGYFYKNQHLILVEGYFEKDMFLLDDAVRKTFNFLEYDPHFKNPNDDKDVIYIFNDDSFSQWEYTYQKGIFELKNKSSFCD